VIQYKRVKENGIIYQAENGNAGYDLISTHDIFIPRGSTGVIETGVAVEIPNGFVGIIYGRSGLAFKHGIRPFYNGVIDSSYRGELKVKLESAEKDYYVMAGDKIAQLVILPYHNGLLIEVDDLTDTTRGENGFGSSGK